jgi:MYXO-CTERM domain-containing protein
VGNRSGPSASSEERMRNNEGFEGGSDRSLVLFLLALAALVSPALRLWIAPGSPWWSLYAVWALIVLAAALAARRRPEPRA